MVCKFHLGEIKTVELDFEEYSDCKPDEGEKADEGKGTCIPWGIAFGLCFNDSHFVWD